jgi:putative Holliday junction resolvase
MSLSDSIVIMTEETILAIDYGTVRVGLAKSVLSLAQPLYIVGNNPDLFRKIKELCLELQITTIVVGISENQMAEKTKAFVSELEKVCAVPVVLWDETLSSHTVHQKARELGWSKGKQQRPIDHLAAAEILQDWLDSR